MSLEELEMAQEEFENYERRLRQMLSGECMQTCQAYAEDGDIACIACSDYW